MYTIPFMYSTSLQVINKDNGYLNNTFLTKKMVMYILHKLS